MLNIYIHIKDTIVVSGDSATIRMISFDGHCESQYFTGRILPGGIDTQRVLKDGTTFLSARYCMEGVDMEGRSCRIFIDNTGVFYKKEDHTTVPKIYTDSVALKWMEDASLVGSVDDDNGKLVIRIRQNER